MVAFEIGSVYEHFISTLFATLLMNHSKSRTTEIQYYCVCWFIGKSGVINYRQLIGHVTLLSLTFYVFEASYHKTHARFSVTRSEARNLPRVTSCLISKLDRVYWN